MFLITAQQVQAQLAESPWPMYHGGPQHRSQSPYDTSHIEAELKWKYDVGNGIESSPVIGPDGTIYVGIFKDRFYAFNPDGTVKWILERSGEEFRSTAAIGKDGTIYVGATSDHVSLYNIMHDDKSEYGTPKVYALNPDGSVKWEFITGGLYSGTYSAPLIGPDNTIYMGSGETRMKPGTVGGGRLWAINPDGTGKWDFYTDNAFYTTPAMSEDGSTIYATCADYNIYALQTSNGNEVWHFTSGEAYDGSPTIGEDGTIYAGSVDKNLYAFSPDGTVKWYFTANEIVEATPSIGKDGTIYVGTLDTGSKDHNLYALTPEGKEKWRFETGDGVYATPAIGAEGTLYFGSYDGNLYALTPEGEEKWHFETYGGIIGSPAIDKDGTIYFGSWDHHLYALGGSVSSEEGSSNLDEGIKPELASFDKSQIIVIVTGIVLIATLISAFILIRLLKARKSKYIKS